jgi:hypothetical protein
MRENPLLATKQALEACLVAREETFHTRGEQLARLLGLLAPFLCNARVLK